MARVGEELKKNRLDANMTLKQVAKKLGVSESFVNEVEQGRKVVNEDLLKRFSKVFDKNISTMGLGSLEEAAQTESVARTKEVIKKEVYVSPKTPVNELWNQAFGENIKNVPVFDETMKSPISHKGYVVEGKKIEGFPMDKVLLVKSGSEDLKGYGIRKDDLLFGVEAKDIQGTSFMLVSVQGKNLLRRVKNLNNGSVELLSYREKEEVRKVPIKDVLPLVKFHKLERAL
ncbi:helix-turn-helix domain-containing protein [Proteiniclasticum ruminis]|uniref:helix-turn-helix domain-containing protein n=1 Tax=Proteiniclasticum ruminis TaxID=398199 RepID=UPI0028AE6C3D|nr:helix-turn-helix transcriptional regulator [Proteiniclasticum ruminis]